MFNTNKSRVKRKCIQNGWHLFEIKEGAEYVIRVTNGSMFYVATGRSLHKNLAYEQVLQQIQSEPHIKQIV